MNSTVQRSNPGRGFDTVSAALIAVGVGLFVWSGAQHPGGGTDLGTLGSDRYFRNLAQLVTNHPWEQIHAGLLAGPLLWTLGMRSLILRLREGGELRFSGIASVSLTVGACLWAVAFAFAAFAIPVYAEKVGITPTTDDLTITLLRATQTLAFRLGLAPCFSSASP